MYHRINRLFIIRFLGLWAGNQGNLKTDENKESNKHNIRSFSGFQPDKLNDLDKVTPRIDISLAIAESEKKILGLILEKGIPGLTICVSKQGNIVWRSAFGFCDVENQLACEPDACMRIASISKPLFATTVVAPMIEKNKLKLKSSVHQYLTAEEFPRQKFQDIEYDITVEQLLSHTSGIRHYGEQKEEDNILKPICSTKSKKVYQSDDQYNREGFYQRLTYRNVIDALQPLKDGPLVSEPGKFYYTTYGYTLLSAVVQKASQKEGKTEVEQIEDFWMKILHQDWNMTNTYLDQDEVIIPKRARYYLRTSLNGGLINAPYQDSSVKWAGGGVVSTTNDLVEFANALLNCYKGRDTAKLKQETIELLWKEIKDSYALGFIVKSIDLDKGKKKIVVYHDGGALGASSLLMIYPESELVVAILTNLGSVNLKPLGFFIADEFEKLE